MVKPEEINFNKKMRMSKCIYPMIIFLILFSLTAKYYLSSIRHSLKVNDSILLEGSMVDSNYGVVVDCGSSGSRLFVYYWKQHSGMPSELLNITNLVDLTGKAVLIKKNPGLSSLADTPSDAIHYFEPLLQFAIEHIPYDKITQTPLYIMATAGLRLLSEEKQKAILENLRKNIPLHYNFIFADTHVEVISGKWEGLYAWIAVNLALGKFNNKLEDLRDKAVLTTVDMGGKVHVRKKTVGSMDLGGASMQTTFELPPTMVFLDAKIRDSVVELDLGCTSQDSSHRYRLFTQTFLGFGGNEARKRLQNHLLLTSLNYSQSTIIKSQNATTTNIMSPNFLQSAYTNTHTSSKRSFPSRTPLSINNHVPTKLPHPSPPLNTTLSNVIKDNHDKDLNATNDNSKHANTINKLKTKYSTIAHRLKRSKRSTNDKNDLTIQDPCSPSGLTQSFQIDADALNKYMQDINKDLQYKHRDSHNINSADDTNIMKNIKSHLNVTSNMLTYTLVGSGNMDECVTMLRGLMNKSQCEYKNQKRCVMNGVVMPDFNYKDIQFYGFSEFYYTMEDILGIGGDYDYQNFIDKAKKYCETSWEQIEEWEKANQFPRADSERYQTQCFKSAWMVTMLHDGLNLPKSFNNLTSIVELQNLELHWSLGALLYKTRLFPLRDIEKKDSKTQPAPHRWVHSTEFIITLFLVCLLASVLFYLCLNSIINLKFFKRKVRTNFTSTDDFSGVVVMGDNQSDKQKMVRSRSFGVLNSQDYSEI